MRSKVFWPETYSINFHHWSPTPQLTHRPLFQGIPLFSNLVPLNLKCITALDNDPRCHEMMSSFRFVRYVTLSKPHAHWLRLRLLQSPERCGVDFCRHIKKTASNSVSQHIGCWLGPSASVVFAQARSLAQGLDGFRTKHAEPLGRGKSQIDVAMFGNKITNH